MCVMALWKSSSARKFTGPAVDKKVHPAHIAPVGAPPLGAMARLRSSSLNIRWQSFRLRSAAGGFDALWSPEGRGHCSAPGCLTSESEERETWTAESLRAASSNGEGLGLFRKSGGRGKDFGGRRFRSTLWTTCEAHASQETKVGPRQTL